MEQPKKQALNRNLAYIEETAKSNGWLFKYDEKLDELYWSKPTISSDTKLIKLTDDFAFYIKPSGEIEGIFIEYAKFNFFAHEKSLKELLSIVESTDHLKTEELSVDLMKKFTDRVKAEAIEVASFNNVLEIF